MVKLCNEFGLHRLFSLLPSVQGEASVYGWITMHLPRQENESAMKQTSGGYENVFASRFCDRRGSFKMLNVVFLLRWSYETARQTISGSIANR
jgi:hypothetical protein